VDPTEEVVRMLAIQLRRQTDSQAEAITELSRAGFGPTRIAELLGTTPNTVNVTIAKSKKKRPKED
jgi:DNA-binding CsgD family transcriptional regulator